MSSILTNNAAMTALQTLKGINNNLEMTQAQISTGKKIASAKDNSAIWAISKTMESDVAGFKAISDSLALGDSTVAVGKNAAETTTDLLNDIKEKVVASQEENVDRQKLQNDIEQLRDQIKSTVSAAQFNGKNLVTNSDETNILSSLDRAADQSVQASDITFNGQDLTQTQQVVDTTGTNTADVVGPQALNATQTASLDLSGITPTAGTAYGLDLAGTDTDNSSFTAADYTVDGSGGDIAYVAKEGDTAADIAEGLAAKYGQYASENGLDTENVLSVTASGSSLDLSSTVTDGTDTIAVAIDTLDGGGNNVAGGGLEALANIDVTTKASADTALANVEGLIQTSIDAAAAFGSVQGRIETQSNFVSNLTDSLESGIGSLVDANMEEASARLQALQTQQQLGIQALSIANSQSQNILALFRG